MKLDELVGSRWEGKSELWDDPSSDVGKTSDCSIAVDDGVVAYSWSYEGKPHAGKLKLRSDGAEFSDSWHQQEPTACTPVPGSRALLSVQYTYMKEWGWRINLCFRESSDELVLQMTNITPWGEEARAVRMVCKRSEG